MATRGPVWCGCSHKLNRVSLREVPTIVPHGPHGHPVQINRGPTRTSFSSASASSGCRALWLPEAPSDRVDHTNPCSMECSHPLQFSCGCRTSWPSSSDKSRRMTAPRRGAGVSSSTCLLSLRRRLGGTAAANETRFWRGSIFHKSGDLIRAAPPYSHFSSNHLDFYG